MEAEYSYNKFNFKCIFIMNKCIVKVCFENRTKGKMVVYSIKISFSVHCWSIIIIFTLCNEVVSTRTQDYMVLFSYSSGLLVAKTGSLLPTLDAATFPINYRDTRRIHCRLSLPRLALMPRSTAKASDPASNAQGSCRVNY